ncbi:hypothetical protein MtrunA17_Chr3g0140241 [Medicago truncatula]|uniref:Uncharacterized protein n=1 Tax=Medicago truncatula TaxID=3880 RepID=A0A396IYP2_MEDTR|nr:hypothetical protein MtrunA17_Chr3g0140241 [Medicago truncatula]
MAFAPWVITREVNLFFFLENKKEGGDFNLQMKVRTALCVSTIPLSKEEWVNKGQVM